MPRIDRHWLYPRASAGAGDIDEVTEHNVGYLYREIAWAGISNGVLGGFLSIFALRLGATAFEVGLLTTGPAIAGILVPLPASRLLRRMWSKAVVFAPLAMFRMVFAVVAAIPLLPGPLRVPVLVSSYTLLAAPSCFFNTGFVPLLGKLLSRDIRAHVVGVRNTVVGLTTTITVLAVGKVLDALPFPINFQIVFLIGLVAAQTSTFLVSHVRLPALNEQAPAARNPGEGEGARANTPHTKMFWCHTISAVVFSLGIAVPAALYPIVLVDKLHATNGWIGGLATLTNLASVVCTPLWSRAAMRRGNRVVLVAGAIGFTLVPLGASLVPSVAAYVPVSLGMGAFMAGINLGLFQCLLDVAPESRQTHYTAMYSMLVNGAGALGPLLGTTVLVTVGMTQAFMVAEFCVLLGGVLFWLVGAALSPQR